MDDSVIKHINIEPIRVSRKNIVAGSALMNKPKGEGNYILLQKEVGVVYYLTGKGHYVDHATNRIYPFRPGSLRIWAPETPHTRYVYPGQTQADKYISLPREYYTILKKMNLVSPNHPIIDLGLHISIANRYDEIIEELQHQPELQLPVTINKAFAFITELLLPRPSVNRKWHDAMENAAAILEKDVTEKINIPELAGKLNMSCTNFRRIFMSFYGVSPIKYRIQKRIEMIQKTLSSEDILIKEVAERFGYPDIYTFSRQFRKYTNHTPSEFKQYKR